MTRARRSSTEPDDARPSTSAATPVVARRKHCVMMLSDFFLPSIGGVELHIYALATRLRARGHKVVVYTHAHPGRVGVRWITSGIKVYHVPRVVMYDNCTFPNFLGAFKLFRKVRRRRRRVGAWATRDVCFSRSFVRSYASRRRLTAMTPRDGSY